MAIYFLFQIPLWRSHFTVPNTVENGHTGWCDFLNFAKDAFVLDISWNAASKCLPIKYEKTLNIINMGCQLSTKITRPIKDGNRKNLWPKSINLFISSSSLSCISNNYLEKRFINVYKSKQKIQFIDDKNFRNTNENIRKLRNFLKMNENGN